MRKAIKEIIDTLTNNVTHNETLSKIIFVLLIVIVVNEFYRCGHNFGEWLYYVFAN